jgi:hypothetical protein
MRYFLWALFLILNPFYLFDAGTPQISDMLQFTVMLFSFSVIRVGYKKSLINKKMLVWFFWYAVIVNLVLFLIYFGRYKGVPMLANVFFTYNIAVLFYATGLAFLSLKKFIKFTQWGILLSVSIQVGYFLLFGSENFNHLRPSFFFANPNQLGYFGLLMLTIFLLLNKMVKVNLVSFIMVFLMCMLIALVSASKAAVGGSLFLFAYFLFDAQLLKGYGIVAVIVIVSVSYTYIYKSDAGSSKTTYILKRVDDGAKKEGITEWEYRGYDRMSNHPYYLVLGAGEGMYSRFNTFITKHEIHSSFGNILFSYGIPGLITFMIFFFSLFKGLPIKTALYIIPVVLYSFTHMGLRFTPIWILFGMFPLIRAIKIYMNQQKIAQSARETQV